MSDRQHLQIDDYLYHLTIPTRWRDVDMYAHVNNVVFYAYFDTVIGHYLMEEGGLDYATDNVVGFAVESQCQFLKPIRFPDVLKAGLRVKQLGNSSVTYEIGIFRAEDTNPAAFGYFVHVFVNRTTGKSTPVPEPIRAYLEKLLITGK